MYDDIYSSIKNREIFIELFSPENLTPAGYNLTPTHFIFSTKKKHMRK